MIRFISLLLWLLPAIAVHAQSYTSADSVVVSHDTLFASFHQADNVSGDTVFFGMNGAHEDKLLYFFQQHLRAPYAGDSSVLGTVRIFFIIDKIGTVTQAWYYPSDNTDIGLSVLRVVNQLPAIKPSSIKGEPVVTKVLLKVLIEKEQHPYTGPFVPDITEIIN
jgi:hypothetical protein